MSGCSFSIPVIALFGKARSGKTTAIDLLSKHYDVRVLNFADSLKKACEAVYLLSSSQLFDQEEKKKVDERWGVTSRKIFQATGDLFRDHLSKVLPDLHLREKSIFTDNLLYRLEELLKLEVTEKSLIVIGDGRLPDENEFCKRRGIPTVLLRRDDPTGSTDSHISEKLQFTTDYTINNNGTLENLSGNLLRIVESIKIKSVVNELRE